MKKIIMSLLVIVVALGLVGVAASGAWFSDVETSSPNIMTAGTVDIDVGGENPWTATYTEALSDMKPCDTKWITFTINNVGGNPVDVWKHLEITDQTGGVATYPTATPVASSEPEWTEGGGASYVERDNLASFIIYDLYVRDVAVIHEDQQVRLDNVDCIWIYLGTIAAGGSMKVEQSYHLMGWDDSGQEITNWPQGDTVTFSIELYAEQVTGPGPIASSGNAQLGGEGPGYLGCGA